MVDGLGQLPYLIIRCNSIVGPSVGWGSSFSERVLYSLRQKRPIRLFYDQVRSPIHIRNLVEVIVRSINSGLTGILHAGGPERQNRVETGKTIAAAYELDDSLIQPASYLEHERASIMHADGSFDTTLLSEIIPEIQFDSLLDNFRIDAKQHRQD